MKIEDNFLDQEKFDDLQTHIMGSDFAWYYNDIIDYLDESDRFQFIHFFYKNHYPLQQTRPRFSLPVLHCMRRPALAA